MHAGAWRAAVTYMHDCQGSQHDAKEKVMDHLTVDDYREANVPVVTSTRRENSFTVTLRVSTASLWLHSFKVIGHRLSPTSNFIDQNGESG